MLSFVFSLSAYRDTSLEILAHFYSMPFLEHLYPVLSLGKSLWAICTCMLMVKSMTWYVFICHTHTHSSRGLMYGYAVSGAEAEGSAFANLTNRPVPEDFRESIIPSLLFGSLISATDPGKRPEDGIAHTYLTVHIMYPHTHSDSVGHL